MRKADNFNLISIIVPAYKQEKTIIKDIKNLEESIASIKIPYEIIVVVDGFVDKTYEKVQELKSKKIKILGYKENLGKGYAVKFGVQQANGDLIGFIDAGMDVDPAEIAVAIDLLRLSNADIVVGSKLHPDSKVNYPFERRIMSWGYRALTHIMFGFSVRDTQVGMKIFKKKAARDIFTKILVKKFAFDIEVLAVAYSLGYSIVESPININFQQKNTISSTNFWKVIFSMLWDTTAVFYRLKLKHYYDK